jgi:hypothetical protein
MDRFEQTSDVIRLVLSQDIGIAISFHQYMQIASSNLRTQGRGIGGMVGTGWGAAITGRHTARAKMTEVMKSIPARFRLYGRR